MCGRFSEVVKLSVMAERFKARFDNFEWKPRYNLAPGQEALVVTHQGERRLELMRWGLVPSWAKDINVGYKMINARAETIAEKPSYRKPFQKSRCLVLADGFYEWVQIKGHPKKTPIRIVLKNREPFAFAGIFDTWSPEKKMELKTFTIVTTEANSAIRQFHDRMPVILEEKDEDLWINPKLNNPDKLKSLLKPLPSSKIEFYEVSTIVNKAENDTEECLKPVNFL